MKNLLLSTIMVLFLLSCQNDNATTAKSKTEQKHHLNIPEKGIESLMEGHSQKIIEGTDGSIVIMIGNVTRNQADITIKKEDEILEEKMVDENSTLSFNYEGSNYTIDIGKIKKPLLGEGKVNLSIK